MTTVTGSAAVALSPPFFGIYYSFQWVILLVASACKCCYPSQKRSDCQSLRREGAMPGFVARGIHAVLVLPVLLAIGVSTATAQGYPNKPVRLIIAQGAGSATDIMGRIIGQKISDAVGQQVVVDNRAGAGGLLGTELAAKATPDGHTLFLASISTHGVNPALYRKLPYDPVRDFAPVSMTGLTANLFVVHPSVAAATVGELIALLKARPGQLNFASPGNGSSQHLAIELFKSMTGGLKMMHVPYKGGPPAITAVMAGEVAGMIPAMPLALPHVKSRKVRAIAVTTAARIPEMPEIPTVAETVPGFEVVTWYGLMAPAATPKTVVATLNKVVVAQIALPDTRKSLAASGLSPLAGTPEEMSRFVKAELAKWAKVARDAGIRLD
ncbi:MAG: tripartite tricarboxylate transporter substrate binding protein [Burkholderiales bacterium]|nr:tripartite tricarboxylate transporter substrate binding protein [Burkholderiales bacterium]